MWGGNCNFILNLIQLLLRIGSASFYSFLFLRFEADPCSWRRSSEGFARRKEEAESLPLVEEDESLRSLLLRRRFIVIISSYNCPFKRREEGKGRLHRALPNIKLLPLVEEGGL